MFNQFPAEQLREDRMTKIEVKNKFRVFVESSG
jgi:hypothetical protein